MIFRRSASASSTHFQVFMKSFLVSTLFPVVVALTLGAMCGGCKSHDFSYSEPPDRRTQPLAPISAVSPGIGGPGGDSADTRATGTVASGARGPSAWRDQCRHRADLGPWRGARQRHRHGGRAPRWAILERCACRPADACTSGATTPFHPAQPSHCAGD